MKRDPLPGRDFGASPVASRRDFLRTGAAFGGGLVLSFALPGFGRMAEAAARKKPAGPGATLAPNGFVRVAPDGAITLVVNKAEMGQGVYTSFPMLIAEELDVGLDQVKIVAAPPDEKLYADPILHFQVTGNSSSVRGAWEPLRQAGATARAMLVAAAARTWRADPAACRTERATVIHEPTGRKLAYGALANAAAGLPVPKDVKLKDPKDFRLIGKPVRRTDTPDKVNGKALFTIDIRMPGMVVATARTCPVFGGRLARVDDSRAAKVPGVRKVVRLDDAVAVIGDHMWAAKQGLDALDIVWDEGPNAKLTTDDISRQLEEASKRPGLVAMKKGDAGKALGNAAKRIDATYEAPFLSHAPMEPMTCVVHVRPDGCDLWVGTQVPTRAQDAARQVTGLPPDRIRVHNQYLGGAFGRRLEVDFIAQAVQIAKQWDGPVKMIWTREQDIQRDMYRPHYFDRISAGLDANGMPAAWTHRIVGSSVMARFAPPALREDGLDPDAVECASTPPYDFPNLFVDYVRQEPPGIPTAFWRGVGPTHNVFVLESFVDELANAAGKDPVAYRLALLQKNKRATAVVKLAAEKAGWGRTLPKGRGMGFALTYVFDTYLAQATEVSVSPEGLVRAHRIVAAVDCGQIVNPDTVRAQVEGGILFGLSAALYNEITLKDGRVEQSNFHDYRMLRIDETPEMEVHLIQSTEPPGGIGETGTVTAAPALTNAIHAATGTRIRRLPVVRTPLRSA